MRIIDERGKLFGKVNVIDFLVIVFLFCLMPMFYFGYKLMTKKPVAPMKKESFVIEANCHFIKLQPELLQLILVDDKELDAHGEVIGEIISLGEIVPYKYTIDIGKGQKITQEHANFKQIKAKIKLKVEARNNELYYKGNIIKIDLPFKFETDKYTLTTIPFKEEVRTVTAILRAKFSNISPELTKVIKIGDKQVETFALEADIKREVSRIIKIISNEPAEVISLMGDRKNWVIIGHPKYRDVVLEIEMFCVRKPEGLFNKNTPIKIGGPFTFSTDLYSLSGTIIAIEIK